MGVVTTILTSLLTSTVVSALLVTFLKYTYDRRLLELTHSNQVKLAQLSEDLQIVQDAVLERYKQRREVLPKIVEGVYRIRNGARELNVATNDFNQLLNSFNAEIRKLEVDLYQHRVLLAIEDLFPIVHAFKNDARTFSALTSDLIFLGQSEPEANIRHTKDQRTTVYAEIDRGYNEITEQITSLLKEPVITQPDRSKP